MTTKTAPATDTDTRTDPRADEKPKTQPPYAVIIEDDDEHTYAYVIELLQKVCGHSQEKAYLLARTVDTEGEALVWSGALEVAELKRDQIRNFGPDFYAAVTVRFPLGVRIEAMPG
ncbi:MAG: ATP-dependent Clp protease adaptor ClpS [Phycisphaera sp.]|nr:ATP-dependent Clp protease adaptor ClpS [Phycisphaera sp.]